MHLEAVRSGLITDDGQFILVVGEDNPLSVAPHFALHNLPPGCTGHRLCSKVMGLRPHVYLSLWRTNLCNPAWSKRVAEVRAQILSRPGTPWRKVVLLGRKVAGSFGRPAASYFDVWDGGDRTGDKRFLLLPHPSGRNWVWGNPDNYTRSVLGLRELAPEIPWKESCLSG
jgi:hypothetical protein